MKKKNGKRAKKQRSEKIAKKLSERKTRNEINDIRQAVTGAETDYLQENLGRFVFKVHRATHAEISHSIKRVMRASGQPMSVDEYIEARKLNWPKRKFTAICTIRELCKPEGPNKNNPEKLAAGHTQLVVLGAAYAELKLNRVLWSDFTKSELIKFYRKYGFVKVENSTTNKPQPSVQIAPAEMAAFDTFHKRSRAYQHASKAAFDVVYDARRKLNDWCASVKRDNSIDDEVPFSKKEAEWVSRHHRALLRGQKLMDAPGKRARHVRAYIDMLKKHDNEKHLRECLTFPAEAYSIDYVRSQHGMHAEEEEELPQLQERQKREKIPARPVTIATKQEADFRVNPSAWVKEWKFYQVDAVLTRQEPWYSMYKEVKCDLSMGYCWICNAVPNVGHERTGLHIANTLRAHVERRAPTGNTPPPTPRGATSPRDSELASSHGEETEDDDIKFFCETCRVEVEGEAQYAAHLAGAKHARRLNPTTHFCHTCGVAISGNAQLEEHLAGTQHRAKTINKAYTCECGAPVSGEDGRAQHEAGRKHTNWLALHVDNRRSEESRIDRFLKANRCPNCGMNFSSREECEDHYPHCRQPRESRLRSTHGSITEGDDVFSDHLPNDPGPVNPLIRTLTTFMNCIDNMPDSSNLTLMSRRVGGNVELALRFETHDESPGIESRSTVSVFDVATANVARLGPLRADIQVFMEGAIDNINQLIDSQYCALVASVEGNQLLLFTVQHSGHTSFIIMQAIDEQEHYDILLGGDIERNPGMHRGRVHVRAPPRGARSARRRAGGGRADADGDAGGAHGLVPPGPPVDGAALVGMPVGAAVAALGGGVPPGPPLEKPKFFTCHANGLAGASAAAYEHTASEVRFTEQKTAPDNAAVQSAVLQICSSGCQNGCLWCDPTRRKVEATNALPPAATLLGTAILAGWKVAAIVGTIAAPGLIVGALPIGAAVVALTARHYILKKMANDRNAEFIDEHATRVEIGIQRFDAVDDPAHNAAPGNADRMPAQREHRNASETLTPCLAPYAQMLYTIKEIPIVHGVPCGTRRFVTHNLCTNRAAEAQLATRAADLPAHSALAARRLHMLTCFNEFAATRGTVGAYEDYLMHQGACAISKNIKPAYRTHLNLLRPEGTERNGGSASTKEATLSTVFAILQNPYVNLLMIFLSGLLLAKVWVILPALALAHAVTSVLCALQHACQAASRWALGW